MTALDQSTPQPLPATAEQKRLTRIFLLLAAFLSVLMGGLSVWEYQQTYATALQMAATDNRSSFNKDLVYRRWAAMHGGVYVPVTGQTPPNPNLAHIPERDITTPSGKELTLMNPAYMTRQVHELAKEQYGSQGHITSLKPIRPQNAPDPWEEKVLQSFIYGTEEITSVEMINGEPYLRLMRPLIAESGCLKCHAQQGYKAGDIRGGISVSAPLAPFLQVTEEQAIPVYFGFALIWGIGLLGLWLTAGKLQSELRLRIQADEAVRQSEAHYRNFFENNYSTMLLIEPESGQIVDANPAASSYYGWTLEELKQKNIMELNTLSPKEIAAEMAEAKLHSRNYFVFQHRLANGTIRDVEVYSCPLPTQERTLLFSIIHDISKRREAERKLERSEALYHDLVTSSQDLVWQCDTEGRYTYLNPAWEKTFGYHLEEMLGHKFSEFQRPADAARDFNQFQELLTGGSVTGHQTTHLAKNGDELHLVFNATTVLDEQGRYTGTRGTAYDMTTRLRQEQALIQSLKEKEVMVKEIHHRVKNNMQVIYSLLNLQANSIDDPAMRSIFEESKNRVGSMALIHEKLYQTKDFASVDFKEYLQVLAAGLADSFKRPDVRIMVEMESLHLDVNTGIPCGLIANELVTNSFKHAFPGGRGGTITLGLTRTSDGMNRLTVCDDGIGFPADIDFRQTTSLGLQLVNVLTGQIHGTLELSTVKGSCFSITFPDSEELQSAGD